MVDITWRWTCGRWSLPRIIGPPLEKRCYLSGSLTHKSAFTLIPRMVPDVDRVHTWCDYATVIRDLRTWVPWGAKYDPPDVGVRSAYCNYRWHWQINTAPTLKTCSVLDPVKKSRDPKNSCGIDRKTDDVFSALHSRMTAGNGWPPFVLTARMGAPTTWATTTS